MLATPFTSRFGGARVLITGGLGFIGSNLAIALVESGARVTLVDAMMSEYGGNLFNIEPIRDRVTINFSDIRDVNVMNYLVRDQEFVFHLAGQMDHVLSLTDPYPDIEINVKGTTVVMESLKRHNPKARLIYSGTRGQYGAAVTLPVPEDAPTHPRGLHEITRLTAENIVSLYHEVHGIRSTMLRLTNIFGPRAQMRHPRYGVANWFVRLAIEDQVIPVFGDGRIKRDFLYIDDCVEAILMCAASDRAYGQVFNVGVDRPSTFLELAETVVDLTGTGRWEFAPFSPERKAQEPGDFYSDITKIRRLIGWEPRSGLREGLAKTVAYYRECKSRYW